MAFNSDGLQPNSDGLQPTSDEGVSTKRSLKENLILQGVQLSVWPDSSRSFGLLCMAAGACSQHCGSRICWAAPAVRKQKDPEDWHMKPYIGVVDFKGQCSNNSAKYASGMECHGVSIGKDPFRK